MEDTITSGMRYMSRTGRSTAVTAVTLMILGQLYHLSSSRIPEDHISDLNIVILPAHELPEHTVLSPDDISGECESLVASWSHDVKEDVDLLVAPEAEGHASHE